MILSLEEQTTRAVRLLSAWKKVKRPTISLEIKDYDQLFEGVEPVRVAIDQATREITLVILRKETAEKHLRKKYSLTDKPAEQLNPDGPTQLSLPRSPQRTESVEYKAWKERRKRKP